MSENNSHVVEIHELTKKYGDFTALDRLSITLDKGQILGFIGPNGAGKTTTIKILVGLARPTSGTAKIAGVDCVNESRKIKRMVGYMPDTFGAYDNMRVHEYLDFFGAAFKIPRAQRAKRMAEVMEITNSTNMRDLFVESLSHGMKQRIGIARTLLHDPDVLILDEPANGLDPNARIEMREILLNLAQSGKTLIVTSHILPELSRICDQVAIITQGKLRAAGSLDQVLRRVRQRRVMEVEMVDAAQVPAMAELLRETLEETAEVRASPQEAEVRFTTAADDRKLADILGTAVTRKLQVSQFREVPMDLEDVFLEVTRTQSDALPEPPRLRAGPSLA